MKRSFKIISSFFALSMLAGCAGQASEEGSSPAEEEPAHIHDFCKQITSDAFLASAANCKEKAKYYYSCECGEHSEETFEHGELGQHKYEVVETKEATHMEKGEKTFKCSICEDSYTEEIPIISEHTFNLQVVKEEYLASPATCSAKARYYYSCECGEHSTNMFEYGETLPHTYDDGVVTTEPTHTSCGVKTFTCNVCHDTYTEEIPFLADHTFNLKVADAKYLASPATCKEKARYYYSCECGEHSTETFEYGELGDHNYDEGVVTKDPTHLETGVLTVTCKECGDTFTREIPKTAGHNFNKQIVDDKYLASPATCTAKAKYYYVCECGEHSTATYENGDLLPHNYGEGTVTKPATVDEEGIMKYVCVDCGHIKEETIPKHVHKYDQQVVNEKYFATAATCTAKAKYYYSCECGEYSTTSTFETGELAPHTYNQGVVIKEPRTYEEGMIKYTCTVCGYEDNRPIPKHVHSYDKQVIDPEYLASPANCQEKAKYYYSCECGEVTENENDIFEYGEYGPHSYGSGVITKQPTATEKGTIKYTCALCGDEHIEELGFESEGLEFALEDDGYIVTGPGTCTDQDLVIPLTHESKPVIGIGRFAFYGCEWLKTIAIPNCVTKLGVSAFEGCSSLKQANIPSGVTEIPYELFYDCYSLLSVNIPIGVATIGEKAFEECQSLVSVSIPDTVLSIGSSAFEDCYSLKSISLPKYLKVIEDDVLDSCESITSMVLPDGVETIGSNAFYACTALESINIPDGVISIGDFAFAGCGKLNLFTLSKNLTSIGRLAFYGCESIETIVIPEGVNRINDSTFSCCTSLTSIDLPDTITFIGDCAFVDCESLLSIDLPSNLTSIERSTFDGCESLESIYIPATVSSIERSAFDGCSNINSIEVDEDNQVYDSRNNCNAIIETSSGTLIRGCNTTVVPTGVKHIGDFAFTDTTSLKTVIIPEGVESVGDCVFMDCAALEKVTIPSTVTSLGEYLFWYTSTVTTIEVAEGNTVYDSRNNCNAIIETSTNTLLFGCKNTVIPSTIKIIGESAFDGNEELESIVIPYGVTKIGEEAFCECTSLASVVLPETLESIDYGAFEECTSLKSIVIPEGVTSVDGDVFYECSALESVTIPSTLKTIGDAMFCDCPSLKTVNISEGVTRIDNYAFERCYALENITLPSTITSIGYLAFCECVSLSSIIIPEGVTTIDEQTFSGCVSLKYVVLPSSITEILVATYAGEQIGAFDYCDMLTTVYFGGTKEQYEAIEGKKPENVLVYYYSETQPGSGGNYWHYVNNVPTVW